MENTGSTGNAGPTGLDGYEGPTGEIGTDIGYTGSDGIVGPDGIVGDIGDVGLSSAVGPQGSQGVDGDVGFDGTPGDDGFAGDAGFNGEVGFNGDDGFTGTQGDAGFMGDVGFTGPQGNVGAAGPQGPQGNDGPQGYTGFTGPTGYTGHTGYTGTQGITGITGIIGIRGITGLTGIAGNAGYAGQAVDIVPVIFNVNDPNSKSRQLSSKMAMKSVLTSDHNIAAEISAPSDIAVDFAIRSNSDTTYQAIVESGANFGTSKSGNLTTWSAMTNTSASAASSIMWDGTKWVVARTDANDILVSYNGTQFSAADSGATLAHVAYNGIIYVGIGSGGIYNSLDAVQWTSVSSTILTNTAFAQTGRVIWTGKIWIAGGSGPTYSAAYSSDGVSWTGTSTGLSRVIGLSWNGVVAIAVGAHPSGTISSTSPDGITWTLQSGLKVSQLPAFTSISATPDSTSISVAFVYPVAGNTYTIYLSNGSVYYPTSSPHVISGLSGATLYTVNMYASNGYGSSPVDVTSTTTL
jgi:hypothetical protein